MSIPRGNIRIGARDPKFEPILYLDGISVSFDGFRALNNLSFYVEPGELRAIIGPNGAGKTTMMDVITGKTRPDTGTILFKGSIDLTKFDETDIANFGIGRKFQKPTIFEHHTVFENLELALVSDRSVFASLFFKLDEKKRARVETVLQTIALVHLRQEIAGSLSHGQKQWLEIGMLLIQDPELLLVDEPAAGMTDAETAQTSDMLKEIARDHSVIVVEHDMEFVKSLQSKVTVLHEGSVLAEGSLATVQNDPTVIDVYLGR
jgi:urea transport system ATP-binding protein